jgi:hypothetical protein
MLKLDDFRQGSTLIAETIDTIQQLCLLAVQTLQASNYGIALPIRIPCRHHCLPQTAHCLLRFLMSSEAVVFVVGQDDVIDYLTADLLLSLHIFQCMGVGQLEATSETACCRLFIPTCQHPCFF